MAREIPEVVRAVAGLAAIVLDEARRLPATLPGLTVRLIGQALQASMKVQQQYSGLVARGDELFTGLRGDAEPGMATFDDDVDLPAPAPTPAADRPASRSSAFDRVGEPTDTVAEDLTDFLAEDSPVDGPRPHDDAPAAVPAPVLAVDPDEVFEGLADDTGTEAGAAAAGSEGGGSGPKAADEVTIEAAVAEELIADAVVGGSPPPEPAAVPTLGGLTPDAAPEQTGIVDGAEPDVAALEAAADELVDLGGPEAAASVTPGNPTTGSAASEPLVPPAPPAGTDLDADGDAPAPVSPVEGYDSFSIPALRGRLRGYSAETVAGLLEYERSTRARAPFLTLLQNRLEKLSSDAG